MLLFVLFLLTPHHAPLSMLLPLTALRMTSSKLSIGQYVKYTSNSLIIFNSNTPQWYLITSTVSIIGAQSKYKLGWSKKAIPFAALLCFDMPAIILFQWITNENKSRWSAEAVCTFYSNTNKHGAQKTIDGKIGTESFFSSCGYKLHPWLQVRQFIFIYPTEGRCMFPPCSYNINWLQN